MAPSRIGVSLVAGLLCGALLGAGPASARRPRGAPRGRVAPAGARAGRWPEVRARLETLAADPTLRKALRERRSTILLGTRRGERPGADHALHLTPVGLKVYVSFRDPRMAKMVLPAGFTLRHKMFGERLEPQRWPQLTPEAIERALKGWRSGGTAP